MKTIQGMLVDQTSFLQEKFENWLRIIPAMCHSIDIEGNLVSVSDLWLAKLGYTREEVIGRKSSDFLTPASRLHAIQNVLPEFFRRGFCENVEYQFVCKDGSIMDVLLSAILDDGTVERRSASLAVIQDITEIKALERRVAESEMLYRSLVENQTDLVSLASTDGILSFVNNAYASSQGRQPHEMIGASLFDFVPQEGRAAVVEHFRAVCCSTIPIEAENQIVLPCGETRWIAWTNRALVNEKGHVIAIHSVGRDIQQRVVLQQKFKESEARFRLLSENSSDMVFQLDLNLVRQYVSPACREILGYEPEEMLGIKPFSMVHPDDSEKLSLILQSLLDGHGERRSSINRIRHRNGRWIWVEARFRSLRDEITGQITGVVGSLSDISDRKAIDDRLAETNRLLEVLATKDGLTGLANRRTFDSALSLEFRRARRQNTSIALLMIDVDWFKLYNDHYGHPAGDECLRRIAEVIASSVRRPDDLVARYGGEEFCVLLPNTDQTGARLIAENIRRMVFDLAMEHQGSVGRLVSVSLGIATAKSADFELGETALLQNADSALYEAKRAGRNRIEQYSVNSR